MNYLIGIGVLLFSGIIFYGCKSAIDTKNETKDQINATIIPLMGLSKSSCKGKCPQYSLMVNSNRTVVYEGIRHVDKIGTFTAQVSDNQFNDLKKLLEDVNFSSHKADYTAPIADLQKFTMQYNGHTVLFQRKGGPRDLFPLIEAFDNLVKELDWQPSK